MTTASSLSGLLQFIKSIKKDDLKNKKAFIGFDGFVDNIKKPIKLRQNGKIVYYNSIQEFSQRIAELSGKSGQIEMETLKVKLGGNAPILANAMARLGIESYCLGSMGLKEKHPVFAEMDNRCKAISVIEPGKSDAIEFNDGKIIFSELSEFKNYHWTYIKNNVSIEDIKKMISESRLIAFVDWSNLPHASNIWEGMRNEVIKPLRRNDFFFLFDICDPSRRSFEEINEMLDLVSSFSAYGKVTLALNENEAKKIWLAITGKKQNHLDSTLNEVNHTGYSIYKSMNIDCLLIHPIDRTIAFYQREVHELQGYHEENPTVQTGGGDNFNAGYCLGLLLGLPLQDCVLLAMCASGAYVKNGTSAGYAELIDCLQKWIDELEMIKNTRPQSTILPF